MAEFPALGQKAPAVWRDQLKTYIDDADTAAANAAEAAQEAAEAAIPKSVGVESIVKVTQAEMDALILAGTTVATRVYIIEG